MKSSKNSSRMESKNSSNPNSFVSKKILSNGSPFSNKSDFKSINSLKNVLNKARINANQSKILNLLKKNTSVAPLKSKWYEKIFACFKKNDGDSNEKPGLFKSLKQRILRKPTKKITDINFGHKRKRQNFLIVIYLVKKFIQILRTYAFLKKIFRLKEFHFNLIDDTSSFYSRGAEFGEQYFGNLTNRTSHNYVIILLLFFKKHLYIIGSRG